MKMKANERSVVRVAITDALGKHSLPLARYLRKYDPTIEIIGVSSGRPGHFERYLTPWYSEMWYGELKAFLDEGQFDLIIPVTTKAVRTVSQHPTQKTVMPSAEMIETCLSKRQTLAICRDLGIPVPATAWVNSKSDLASLNLSYPCVVKGVWEAGKNVVEYADDLEALESAFDRIVNDPSQAGTCPLIQEYVHGVGAGFFAFYQAGKLKRWYIHRRIREYPITGGSSTAAETFYHPDIFEYGTRILNHLEWNGVAMVEFKLDERTQRVTFMEINPKFWGSVELGLAAGVNFGELLVRSSRGEDVPAVLSEDAYKRITFLWPFDGDLLNIIERRHLVDFFDYLNPFARTNVRTAGLVGTALKARALLRLLWRRARRAK